MQHPSDDPCHSNVVTERVSESRTLEVITAVTSAKKNDRALFFFFFFSFFQAVNRIPSRKNRAMITSFYSQVLQFEQAAGKE